MKLCIAMLMALLAGAWSSVAEAAPAAAEVPSPVWVAKLPVGSADQVLVVAGVGKTTAWISMHEKNPQGRWMQLMGTPGFIGREGLGKTKEGDGKTPVGTFHFTKAFGIAPDPGCAIPYVKVGPSAYWSGDMRPGKHYNEFVDIREIPDLDKAASEHIIDYTNEYQHCLNISYNENGISGLGSAIFLHCLGDRKPYTGGCVAIPQDKMHFVLQHVRPDCAVVINSMEQLGASL